MLNVVGVAKVVDVVSVVDVVDVVDLDGGEAHVVAICLEGGIDQATEFFSGARIDRALAADCQPNDGIVEGIEGGLLAGLDLRVNRWAWGLGGHIYL
jgi:hypothetical protein